MAVEFIMVRDFDGVARKVAVDQFATDNFVQVIKAAFGAEDAVPTLVSAVAPLPVGARQVGVAPPLGYAQASVTASAALPAIPAGSVSALIVPRAAIRWRDDGTAPTASVGMYLAADQALSYQGSLAAFRMIAVIGTAEVNVSFYGTEA